MPNVVDYSEQKTPKESQAIGNIRVTHPHHPLYNQIVKVLRRAGNPAYAEPCYLIQLADGTRAELPCSWAIPATQVEIEPGPSACAVGQWAGVSEYLTLVRLVQSLNTTPSAEEVGDEYRPLDCTLDRHS